MTDLLRLVAIGQLRNGRVLYMPEPEHRLIVLEFNEWALDEMAHSAGVVLREFEFLSWRQIRNAALDRFWAMLVADHQRVHDAILTGECPPFEQRELPAFAQIIRLGA